MGLFQDTPITNTNAPVINLSKNEVISLTKKAPALKRAYIGLGWDQRKVPGAKKDVNGKDYEFDLDVSVFMNAESGHVYKLPDGFIFYGYQDCPYGSVHYTGDNRDGGADGDDEAIIIDFNKVPAGVYELAVVVTIHEARLREQNFGQVENAFIRVCDDDSDSNPDKKKEILRYDLTEQSSTSLSMIFAKFTRRGSEWEFKAIGDGKTKELVDICQMYGIVASNGASN